MYAYVRLLNTTFEAKNLKIIVHSILQIGELERSGYAVSQPTSYVLKTT